MSWRRVCYSAVWYLLSPIILLRLWLRGRKNSAYRQRLAERFGWVEPLPITPDKVKTICLHAVSVGEVMAAHPLLERLQQEMPESRFWVTTTTPTGSNTVKRLLGNTVLHSYLPYDMPGAVARFLSRTRPAVFLVMETELWPNLYAACKRREIPLLLLNARLSERSVRRYQKIQPLVAETLSNVTAVMARGQQDAERFRQLGTADLRIEVTGNIKFDFSIADTNKAAGIAIRRRLGERMIWCAGSTHRGEEDILLTVHERLLQQFPDLLLILVPRHPERFDAVADLCQQQGLRYVRRSQQLEPTDEHVILLGDSMGELLLWYAASDVAFIGGSLVPIGGHNPLEALAFGVPILSGPHIHNFADLYPPLVATQSTRLVESANELQDHMQFWLEHTDERNAAGQAGRRFLQANKGTADRLLIAIGNELN